jgi:hypothetical protein
MVTDGLSRRIGVSMQDFWSPLQVTIEELCSGFDKNAYSNERERRFY